MFLRNKYNVGQQYATIGDVSAQRLFFRDVRLLDCITFCLIILSMIALGASKCANFEFQCNNGECIDGDGRCDGIPNCSDKSDETAEACIHLNCPEFAYRCAYGACVVGDAQCNGNKDCEDNSDETALQCAPNAQELQSALRGNCSNFANYQCQSGECIDDELKCDGRIDCADGSDETVELCASMYCPSYAFRCGYGACISGGSKCDGLKDCRDGSDEAALLCGYKQQPSSETTTTTTTTRRPKTTRPRPGSTKPTVSGCQFPDDQENLIGFYQSDNGTVEPGETVPDSGLIEFKCKRRYNLIGSKVSYCSSKTWSIPLPMCERFCPKSTVTKGISSSAICEYKGSLVNCGDEIRPGTQATIKCNEGYVPPNTPVVEVLICSGDGEWDHPKYNCIAKCGEVSETVTAFVSGGVATNITEVPWQVAIYSIFNEENYRHICGGTIISPKLVLSAAHCFWDTANLKPYRKEYFTIVAGKYYSDYDRQEYVKVQARNISEIIVHPDFKGRDTFYQNDIAALVLVTPLRFTRYIVPICIQYKERENAGIKTGILGRFAGWGTTESGKAAKELQSINLHTLSYHECRQQMDPATRDTLTDDKFCLYDKYGKTLCQGDSGGGLAQEKSATGLKSTHYLLGILSNAPGAGIQCAENSLTALTNINYFRKFITDIETKYRTN